MSKPIKNIMKTSHKPKILFYDIETSPLRAWVWRMGEQRIGQHQLDVAYDQYNIIALCYEWEHSSEKGQLDWGVTKKDSKKMVEKFTALCDEADIIIGKNNKRFDDKHLNTLRLIHDLPGRPDLMSKVDDLESQIRRHFYLPSFGLDYLSKMLGFGGKDNMCMQDWIDIVEGSPEVAEKSLKKMVKYCSKDVSDTKKMWKATSKHFQPKMNHSHFMNDLVCIHCGSRKIHKNGTRLLGKTLYQTYFCKEHGGYAGKVNLKAKKIILS